MTLNDIYTLDYIAQNDEYQNMEAQEWAGIGVAALGILAPLYVSSRQGKKERDAMAQSNLQQPVIVEQKKDNTIVYVIGGVAVLGILSAIIIANRK